MNCDWTEKISLLLDGEISFDEAPHVEAHLLTCAACRAAHTDFLMLRKTVVSYPLTRDAQAESLALKQILDGARQSSRPSAQTPARISLRERLFVFAPRFNHALFAPVAAFVLLAVALGLVLTLRRQDAPREQIAERDRPSAAQHEEQPQEHKQVASTIQPANNSGAVSPDGNLQSKPNQTAVIAYAAKKVDQSGAVKNEARKHQRLLLANSARIELARDEKVAAASRDAAQRAGYESLFSAAGEPASEVFEQRIEDALVSAGRDEARHFEQAQMLLRSIRNARPNEGRTADVSDERERSQKLLYRNIVLRREAARRGDTTIERALDTLEPILIDIANLPARPARTDVRAIQNRVEKKEIVAMLQSNLAAVPRSY